MQTAKLLPKRWRLPRLPTFPANPDQTVSLFSFKSPSSIHGAAQKAYPTFHIYYRPITVLNAPVTPYYEGSLMLRTFLYVRKKWPDKSFLEVSYDARKAINESYRVDGLPRVMF